MGNSTPCGRGAEQLASRTWELRPAPRHTTFPISACSSELSERCSPRPAARSPSASPSTPRGARRATAPPASWPKVGQMRLPLAGPADLAAVAAAMGPDQALALGRLRAELPGRGARRHPPRARRRQGRRGRHRPHARRHRLCPRRSRPSPCSTSTARACRTRSPRPSPDAAASGPPWSRPCRASPAPPGSAAPAPAPACSTRAPGRRSAPAAGGEHVYLLVRDGADVERFLRDLHERCWLHGFGLVRWSAPRASCSSAASWTGWSGRPSAWSSRARPVLEPPLGQDLAARAPAWSDGEALDTRAACPPLTRVERARMAELKEAARAALAPEAAAVRAAADKAFADRLAERHRVPSATALRMAEARHRGVLLPHVELAFDDPRDRRAPPWPRCCASRTASSARRWPTRWRASPTAGARPW